MRGAGQVWTAPLCLDGRGGLRTILNGALPSVAECKRRFLKQHILPAVLLIIVLNRFEVLYGLRLARG